MEFVTNGGVLKCTMLLLCLCKVCCPLSIWPMERLTTNPWCVEPVKAEPERVDKPLACVYPLPENHNIQML